MFKRLSLLACLVCAGCSSVEPPSTSNEPVETLSSGVTGNVQIDCGSTTGAAPFAADEDFAGGTSINRAITNDTSKVTHPAPAAVYQTARVGNFTYSAKGFAAGSSATIRLHFAETLFSTAGARVFNVSINGATVLSNFDVFKTAGAENRAYIAQFTEPASAAGAYVIQFSSVVSSSLVSGIEINTTPINSCATNNGGCAPNATCTSTGSGTNTCTCNAGYTGTGVTCTPITTPA